MTDLRASMPVSVVTDIDDPDAVRGSVEVRSLGGVLYGYAYSCPGCNERDWLELGDGGWRVVSGDPKLPKTVSLVPSVLHRGCGWHGYLTGGRWVPC